MKFSKLVVSRLIDVYPAHVALIDEHGTILVVNRAWKEFGYRNGLQDPRSCEQQNYLEECDRAHARGARGAATVGDGIRNVLGGAADYFTYAYECHSAEDERWFRLLVSPFHPSKQNGWAVLLHVNISHQRHLARRYLKMRRSTDMVTICAWCKLIQSAPGDWTTFEHYFSTQKGIEFTHGICPKCLAAFRQGFF